METTAKDRKLVVAGLLTDTRGRVLIAQRRADQAHALEWEFPGGKIELGESPEVALRRELREELGARVAVGRVWDVLHHDYGAFEVVMLVYHCTLAPGEQAHCVEVAALAWCTPEDLERYPILAADQPLIERLAREGVPATAMDAMNAPATAMNAPMAAMDAMDAMDASATTMDAADAETMDTGTSPGC